MKSQVLITTFIAFTLIAGCFSSIVPISLLGTPIEKQSLLSRGLKDPASQCCFPEIGSYSSITKSVVSMINPTSNYTFIANTTVYMDIPSFRFRTDSVSNLNGKTSQILVKNQSGETVTYIVDGNGNCACYNSGTKEWNPLCIQTPLIRKANIGNQPAAQYGTTNIAPDYSLVDIISQWTIDAGNGNCWSVNDEILKTVTSQGQFLQSNVYFDHQPKISDPSAFQIPSNCPAVNQCQ